MVYTRPMFTTLLAFGAASFVIVVSAIPIDTNSGPSLTSSAATSTPTSNSHTPTSTSPSQLDAATPSSHDAASPQSKAQVYTFFNDCHDSPLSKQANPNPQRLAPSVPKGTDPSDSHNHRQGTVPIVYDMVHGNSAALSRVIWPGLRGTGQEPSKPDINKMPSHVRWPGMPNIHQGMPSDVRVSGMDISHDMGLRPSDVRVSGKDISDDMVRRPSDVLWPVVNIHHPGGTMDPNSEDTVEWPKGLLVIVVVVYLCLLVCYAMNTTSMALMLLPNKAK
ncbi:hypothetical protein EV360DRAFT_90487 [Lentinula raphanica]|nr:hypothetical protein EV360DRAFT_90487 [Lentinula raphanica]